MVKVKAITDHRPTFLKTVYKYDNLIEIMNHERFINVGEKYIKYSPESWTVYKMDKSRVPRYCGSYETITRAIFYARLNR